MGWFKNSQNMLDIENVENILKVNNDPLSAFQEIQMKVKNPCDILRVLLDKNIPYYTTVFEQMCAAETTLPSTAQQEPVQQQNLETGENQQQL